MVFIVLDTLFRMVLSVVKYRKVNQSLKGVSVNTLELYEYIMRMSLDCRRLPKEVRKKLVVQVPRDADVVKESSIKKESLKNFKAALNVLDPKTLDDDDQMWRERMLQALQYI